MDQLKNTDFLKGKSDSGAALALVLLLVIFLSLWLAAVTVFNSNSKNAAAHNIAKSQQRQADVAAAVDAALAVINTPGASFVPSAGSNYAAGTNCPSVMPDISQATPVYTDANGIKVYCVVANSSSVVAMPAAVTLLGTSTLTPGQTAGLSLSTTGSGCDPNKTFNVNGVIQLGALSVTSPNNTCPFGIGQATDQAGSSTTANNILLYADPGTSSGSTSSGGTQPTVINKATGLPSSLAQPDKSGSLDPHKPGSAMYYYTKYVSGTLPKTPTAGKDNSKVTFEGTCAAPISFTLDSGKTIKAVVVHASSNKSPADRFGNQFDFGWVDDAALATLNAMTDGSSGSCGKLGVPIVFGHSGTFKNATGVKPGEAVFRFERSSATSQTTEWKIQGHAEVVFGQPIPGSNNHVNGCDSAKAGAMVEYGIGARLTLDQSKVFMCDLTTTSAEKTFQYPACAAPEKGYGADFYYSDTDTNGDRRLNSVGSQALIYMKTPATQDESDAATNVTSAAYIASHSNGTDQAGDYDTWTAAQKLSWVTKYGEKLKIAGRTISERLATMESDAHGEKSKAVGTRLGGEDDRVTEGLSDLSVSGSCFAPSAYFHLYESSQSKAHFSQGLMLQALELRVGDKANSLSDYTTSGDVGDRKVRLEIYKKGVRLSVMNVAIRDNFGYRGKTGDGYRILGQAADK